MDIPPICARIAGAVSSLAGNVDRRGGLVQARAEGAQFSAAWQARRMGRAKRYPSILSRVTVMGFASLYPSYDAATSCDSAHLPLCRSNALSTASVIAVMPVS